MVKLTEIVNKIRNDKILSIIVIFVVMIIGTLLYYNLNEKLIYEKYVTPYDCAPFYNMNGGATVEKIELSHEDGRKEVFMFNKESFFEMIGKNIAHNIHGKIFILNEVFVESEDLEEITVLTKLKNILENKNTIERKASLIRNLFIISFNNYYNKRHHWWLRDNFLRGICTVFSSKNASWQTISMDVPFIEYDTNILELKLRNNHIDTVKPQDCDNTVSKGTVTDVKDNKPKILNCILDIYQALILKALLLMQYFGNKDGRRWNINRLNNWRKNWSRYERNIERTGRGLLRQVWDGYVNIITLNLFEKFENTDNDKNIIIKFPNIAEMAPEITGNIARIDSTKVYDESIDKLLTNVYYLINNIDKESFSSYIKQYLRYMYDKGPGNINNTDIDIFILGDIAAKENEDFGINNYYKFTIAPTGYKIFSYIKESTLNNGITFKMTKLKKDKKDYLVISNEERNKCIYEDENKCSDGNDWCWPKLPISGKKYRILFENGTYWKDTETGIDGFEEGDPPESRVFRLNLVDEKKNPENIDDRISETDSRTLQEGKYSIEGPAKHKYRRVKGANCAAESGRIHCSRPWVLGWEKYTIRPYIGGETEKTSSGYYELINSSGNDSGGIFKRNPDGRFRALVMFEEVEDEIM
jgi:hypothetical protein